MNTTNFFKTLYDIVPNGHLQMVIKTTATGDIILSVMVTDADGQPSDNTVRIPFNLRGKPSQIDEVFFEAVTKRVSKAVEMLSNAEQYDKALEESKKNSRAEVEKKAKESKEEAERRKKYEAAMEKVRQLKDQKKYGEAIGQLPKAADFPEHEADIQSMNDELRTLHGQLSMF